jgi:AraC-like DNA-binding protein
MRTPTGTSQDNDRHSELARAIQICRIIALESLTLHQIAARLGCSARTVRRALYALQSVGIDILSGREACHFEEDDDQDDEPRPRVTMHAKAYRLDRRAWNGALYLPNDGIKMPDALEGGAR